MKVIKFILMVNKQGQTRLAQYYQYMTVDERAATEAEIIRKCLARNEMQCSFAEYRDIKVAHPLCPAEARQKSNTPFFVIPR